MELTEDGTRRRFWSTSGGAGIAQRQQTLPQVLDGNTFAIQAGNVPGFVAHDSAPSRTGDGGGESIPGRRDDVVDELLRRCGVYPVVEPG